MKGILFPTVAFVATMLPNFVHDVNADEIYPIPTKCPKEDSMNFTIHIAHECDCTKFYKCHAGVKYVLECSLDQKGRKLHFNPREQVCDYRGRAGCKSSGCTSGSKKPHGSKCSSYLQEENGQWNEIECPEGHYFDDTKLVCDLESRVYCQYKKRKNVEKKCGSYYERENGDWVLKNCKTGEYFNSHTLKCDLTFCPKPEISVNVSHEWNCRWYYTSKNGEKTLQKCKYGNFFDETTGTCKLKSEVNCTDKCPERGSADANKEVQLSHDCCTYYYKCNRDGSRKKVECGRNEGFDDDIRQCVSIETAKCRYINVCPPSGRHRRPHKCKCNLYYDCFNGDSIVEECEKRLHFDPILGICNKAEIVNCTLEY